MQKNPFGQRLKQVFDYATNKEIAGRLDVSEAAAQSYTAGRVPPAELLVKLAEVTNCDLHWLLTGEKSNDLSVSDRVLAKLETVAREQADEIFADASIAGANRDQATLDLLVQFLIVTALVEFRVIDSPADVMSAADLRRAGRFKLERMTIDERIRQLAREEARRGEQDIGGEVGPVKWGQEQVAVPHGGTVDGGEDRLIGDQEISEIQRRLKRRKAG